MSEEKKTKENTSIGQGLKLGISSIILIVTVFVIVIFVNLFVDKSQISWDMTSNELYSIGDTTKEILESLKEKVVIYGLFDDGKAEADYKDVKNLLAKYAKSSNSHLTVKYVDPDKNTKIIKQLDPEGTKELKKNDFVVVSGGKSQKLSYETLFKVEVDTQSFSQSRTSSLAEQAFTGAVKYVASQTTPIIYFMEGQEEGKASKEFKLFASYLEKNNFIVRDINLSSIEAIPQDAGILVFSSPKKDLGVKEGDIVKRYLSNGGKAVFLFDYIETDPDFTEFMSIIKDYNLSLNYDRVKENDSSSHAPGNAFSLILQSESNQVVQSDFEMTMENSRSIKILKNNSKDIIVTPLIKSSSSSFGEVADSLKGKDVPGPLNLSVAVEKVGKAGSSKILVAGNSAFVSETAKQLYPQYFSSNMYFLINVFNWMQDRKDDKVIKAKTYATLNLRIDQLQANLVGLLVILVLPLHILGTGFFVWNRRRNL